MKKGHRLSDGDLSFWLRAPSLIFPMGIGGKVLTLDLHGAEGSIFGAVRHAERHLQISQSLCRSGGRRNISGTDSEGRKK